ncbi:phospholipase D family protein [Psychroserpens sp. MEBiC05023]
MSTFLTGKELETSINKIIWEAKDILLLVSPYIKLDKHFKDLFKAHEYNEKLHIIIVFGKNEKSIKKSLSKDDFDFLKTFPKVSILYAPKLHGKYYGNEKMGVVTSVNLYDFSFTNENIEFGVFSEQSILNQLNITSNNVDNDAFNTCMEIAETSDAVFIKRPIYKTNKLIINIGKTYINTSDILIDNTEYFYGYKSRNKLDQKKLSDFPEEIISGSSKNKMPERVNQDYDSKMGYCIRTGEKITFNPKKPMSYKSFQSWVQFENYDFPEKYCHKSGKESFGKTSMSNPILKK